jgi:hypothetical protein
LTLQEELEIRKQQLKEKEAEDQAEIIKEQ